MAAYARCWNTQRKMIQKKINSFHSSNNGGEVEWWIWGFSLFAMNDDAADMKRITNPKSNDIWFMKKIVDYSISFFVFH